MGEHMANRLAPFAYATKDFGIKVSLVADNVETAFGWPFITPHATAPLTTTAEPNACLVNTDFYATGPVNRDRTRRIARNDTRRIPSARANVSLHVHYDAKLARI